MKIQFLGAAQTVTGSCFMMQTNGKRFCVDCGMHQGTRDIESRNIEDALYDAPGVDFILMTHAHIDHSGLLPRMVKKGFKGKIYATRPTRALLEIMLLDSAHVQQMEAEWRNKKNRRHGARVEEPLYSQEDVLNTLPLFEAIDYDTTFSPTDGVKATFREAGHILGSAFIELAVKNNGTSYRLVFSGDLGRSEQLLLNDPDTAAEADYMFLESTYGNRNHKDEQRSRDELAEAIAYSYGRNEKIIIPAFAVERTQEVLYTLFLLSKENKLPRDLPVFLDSPLAIRATEIFRKHPEYLDSETRALLDKGEHPFNLPNLKFTLKTDESQAINALKGPAVVISASGMCNAGRIQHHLRHNLWKEGASVVFVGFQAKGTPGRKIVDGASTIRILGEDVVVRAKIWTIGGFSAHAGQTQILDWLKKTQNPHMEVFLVHGEYTAQQTLAALIKEQIGLKVMIPAYREECLLKPGRAPERVADPQEIQRRRIDWKFVLDETRTRIAQLESRLTEMQAASWEDQTEIRDRILEVNRHLSRLISEL